MTLLADLIKKRESRVIATATPATPATKVEKVAKVAKVARVNLQTDHTAEPDKAEKLHELDLLIEYVAANNGFSEEDIIEAKNHAIKDVKHALTSFRALARTVRRNRVMDLLQANPDAPRAVYADTDSNPLKVILAIAVRHVAVTEMAIPRDKYDPWKIMTVLDGVVH